MLKPLLTEEKTLAIIPNLSSGLSSALPVKSSPNLTEFYQEISFLATLFKSSVSAYSTKGPNFITKLLQLHLLIQEVFEEQQFFLPNSERLRKESMPTRNTSRSQSEVFQANV